MIMIKKALFILITVLLVSSCSSPRGLSHRASTPEQIDDKASLSSSEQSFINEFLKLPVNSNTIFALSPIGNNVNVVAQEFYTNALDQKCRKGFFIINNNPNQFAVCQNKQGQWRYIKPLVNY